MEQWKKLTGYDRPYMVSTDGRVSNGKRLLSTGIRSSGYYSVALRRNGMYKNMLVHRLVALAYIPNPNGYPCVNHRDEDRYNNSVDNLEWCTYEYNNNYGTCRQRSAAHRRKPVLQMTLDGEIIRRWDGVVDAARDLHISRSGIAGAARGATATSGGYRWRYVD